MNKPIVQPAEIDTLYVELKQFLEHFNLHDSLVKEIKWMPHRQTLKLYIHDIMNLYHDAELYNGKKKTGVLIFEKIQKISIGIGVTQASLIIVDTQIEKLPDSCRLKIKFAYNNNSLDLFFQTAQFPSIEWYQSSIKPNKKDV